MGSGHGIPEGGSAEAGNRRCLGSAPAETFAPETDMLASALPLTLILALAALAHFGRKPAKAPARRRCSGRPPRR